MIDTSYKDYSCASYDDVPIKDDTAKEKPAISFYHGVNKKKVLKERKKKKHIKRGKNV